MAFDDHLNPKSRHSVSIDGTNLWEAYRLIGDPPPVIPGAPPQFNYVAIPGRNGGIDFTEALDNKIHYGNIEGEFTLRHMYNYGGNFAQIVEGVKGLAYGQRCAIVTDDGGGGEGRAWVSGANWGEDGGTLTISYILDPPQDETEEGG